jgi:hypothetical protein
MYSKEKLMYSYLFEDYIVENQDVNFDNTHLWIINSDKIPPHIGISKNLKFFSLKASGKDNGIPTYDTFAFLKRKKIEFILVELKTSFFNINIEEVYSTYTAAIPTKISCITPLLVCFNLNKPMMLFDLMNYLKTEDLIHSVNVYNFFRKKLGLRVYGEKDVFSEIEKLQGVKGK